MKPWSVQIELTEGCNRLCKMCGLNAIRSAPGKYKCMTPKVAEDIASKLAVFVPKARYEFAMHGEPLANPEWEACIERFRYHLPFANMQLTTNGIVMLKGMQKVVDRVFELGIDYIVLDTYNPERDKLRELAAKLTNVTVVDFYEDWVPNKISPYFNHRRKIQRTIVLMDDLLERSGESRNRVIFNHAGSNPLATALDEPLKKTCTIPFRELSICWNGNVNVCCMDWNHEYTVGNVHTSHPFTVWNSEEFEAARRMLQSKSREFDPCSKCDVGSGTRSGLLPKYELPDANTKRVLKAVNRRSKKYDPTDLVQLRTR